MINITLIENRKSNALSLQRYCTNIGYEIKVVKIGPDIHITGIPPIEYSYIAPAINYISKKSRSLELKSTNVSMEDVSIFAEWVNKATELFDYIYDNYEAFITATVDIEQDIEK